MSNTSHVIFRKAKISRLEKRNINSLLNTKPHWFLAPFKQKREYSFQNSINFRILSHCGIWCCWATTWSPCRGSLLVAFFRSLRSEQPRDAGQLSVCLLSFTPKKASASRPLKSARVWPTRFPAQLCHSYNIVLATRRHQIRIFS